MSVALVTTSWPAHEGDPAGHFVRAEARELERSGHRVVVVAPAPGGAFGWPGVAARVRGRPWLAVDAARWVSHARRAVRRLAVDRVIAHWAIPCAWPIGVVTSGELEVVSHGGDVRLLAASPRPIRSRVMHTITSRATRWRFVSDALLDQFLAALPHEERHRVEAIAQVRAASLDAVDAGAAIARRKRDLSGKRVAVSVGRLVSSKRVDRAIDHVARAPDVDALVVVGDGPERGRLERLARERGIDARFVGTVSREEALAWIGAAHVVIHASESEGLSTVVREAEGLGTPVVTLA